MFIELWVDTREGFHLYEENDLLIQLIHIQEYKQFQHSQQCKYLYLSIL